MQYSQQVLSTVCKKASADRGVIEWVFNHVGIRLTTNGKLGLYKISLRPGHRIALSNNPTVQCDEHAPHRPIHMAIHDNHVWKNRQLDFGNLPITSYYCSNRSAYLCTTVTYVETLSPKLDRTRYPLHQNTPLKPNPSFNLDCNVWRRFSIPSQQI